MQIDDFTEPIRRNLYLRFFSTLLIFSSGSSSRSASPPITSPRWSGWPTRRRTWRRGILPGTAGGGKDEVGRLTRAFNGMIAKLRQNRALEEKVREAQYLSQLGRLASGVAHEIRNP